MTLGGVFIFTNQMTKADIIGELAKERRVERTVCNIARTHLTPDLEDLCQDIYSLLLTYPDEIIEKLWYGRAVSVCGRITQMDCFVARVVKNQLSPTGPFGFRQRKQRQRRAELKGDFADGSR
jgi:hypothetical protein